MMPIKKGRNDIVSAFLKNWRRPTLAESIKLLPSARLCLTAEFGMGSGRTTALWPPKMKGRRESAEGRTSASVTSKMLKNFAGCRRALNTAHRDNEELH